MTDDDDQIMRALTASGECVACLGTGTVFDDENVGSGEHRCGQCDATGRDPLALLRAVQAVGLLLLRRPA